MFSGYYQPQDNIASVIPCSPEMSIRTTIADGLIHFLKWYSVLKSIPNIWKKTLKGYNTRDNTSSEEGSQRSIEADGKFIAVNSVTAKLVCKLYVR